MLGNKIIFHLQMSLTSSRIVNALVQRHADVAELADALDSGSRSRKAVQVQVLLSASRLLGFLP